MNSKKNPLVLIALVALSAYGAYYCATEAKKKFSLKNQLASLIPGVPKLENVVPKIDLPAPNPTDPGGTISPMPDAVIEVGTGTPKTPAATKPARENKTTVSKPAGNQTGAATSQTGNQTPANTQVANLPPPPAAVQPQVDEAQLVAAVRRMSRVTGEANAQRERWKSISDSLHVDRLPVSAKISGPINQMENSLDSAEAAIRGRDPKAAQGYLDDAQEAINQLNAEWARRRG